MQNNPLISIVMTIYNREDYLEYAIQSVINQTYKNIEIIVVDDGSKTNYAERICSKYAQCRYYYRSNSGSSASRNFGVSKANGEFIAFLDDDDLFFLDKVNNPLALLQIDAKAWFSTISPATMNAAQLTNGVLLINNNTNRSIYKVVEARIIASSEIELKMK